jgi:hypothetical protein
MAQVTFDQISLHETFSRRKLAKLWGYAGYEAIARGVVTPAEDTKIVLFGTGTRVLSSTDRIIKLGDKVESERGRKSSLFPERRHLCRESTYSINELSLRK